VVDVDVVVIGAGRSGLTAAHHLRRAGLTAVGAPGWEQAPATFVMIDDSPSPGGTWQDRWAGLPVAAARVFDLPGMTSPSPDPTAPARDAVPVYFRQYEAAFALHVLRPARVDRVRHDGERLAVHTHHVVRHEDKVVWRARGVVNATGSWSRPFWPHIQGRETFDGRQVHIRDLVDVAEVADGHTVLVGACSAAVHLLAALSEVTNLTWVTRRPPRIADTDLTPAVRQAIARGVAVARPELVRIGRRGVWFRPGPVEEGWVDGPPFVAARSIVWATGFRPAVAHLTPLHLRLKTKDALDGPEVVAEPRLQLVGSSAPGGGGSPLVAVRNLLRLLGL